jgi:MscS family membrane protein
MKKMMLIALFLTTSFVWARPPLAPVGTENPRQTYLAFIEAMNDYRSGVETKDLRKEKRIWDAVRTLDLSGQPTLTKNDQGKRTAIFLKEVLDRVAVLDPDAIPETVDVKRWRIPDTEITVTLLEQGERAGEYLFSGPTVERAEEFYDKVKMLPYIEKSGQGALYKPTWESERLPYWLQGSTFGFRHWQVIGMFIGIFFGIVFKSAAQLLVRKMRLWTSGGSVSNLRFQFFSAIERPLGLAVAAVFWLFTVYALRFEGQSLTLLVGTLQIIFGVCIIWAIYKLVDVLGLYLEHRMQAGVSMNSHLLPFFKKSLRVFIVVFGALLILQNLGFNVMSILAGLGLGGLAFALAAKDTAANLFGSIMILIDRPFRVGDFINVGGVEGNVEEIGFRSTRIRTLYNSLISIPNSALVVTNIDNYGAREYCRIRTTLGITYDTPPEKIEAFVQGIQNIVLANPKSRKDLYHVVFDGYGDFSLNILVNIFIQAPDLAHELNIRQNIFLEILRLAKKLDVDFAFPTTSLHMETFPEKRPSVIRHQEWSKEQISTTASEFAAGGKESQPQGLGIYKSPPFVNPN